MAIGSFLGGVAVTLIAGLLLTVIKRIKKKEIQVGPLPVTAQGKQVDQSHPDSAMGNNNQRHEKNKRGDMMLCISLGTCV